MSKIFLFLICAFAFAEGSQPKMIAASELAALLEKHNQVYVFDANLESTRKQVGVIPGSLFLSAYDNYDFKILPPDKSSRLVFYCADKMCSASTEAAKRAVEAGYKDVSVMKDGIYGWQKSGQKLAKYDGAPNVGAAETDPKTAMILVNQNQAIIVDVRETDERREIIENEKSFPISKLKDSRALSEFKSKLPKDKTVIFHCVAGIRAKRVADQLAASGIKTMFFKGPEQWKAAGLPLVPGPAQ